MLWSCSFEKLLFNFFLSILLYFSNTMHVLYPHALYLLKIKPCLCLMFVLHCVCSEKSLTEKRRREKESTYMEELAELIYYRGDMNRVNSFKPDKRAILEETVKYFHRLQSEGGKLYSLMQSFVLLYENNIFIFIG